MGWVGGVSVHTDKAIWLVETYISVENVLLVNIILRRLGEGRVGCQECGTNTSKPRQLRSESSAGHGWVDGGRKRSDRGRQSADHEHRLHTVLVM